LKNIITIKESQKIKSFEGIDLHKLKDEVALAMGITKNSIEIGVSNDTSVNAWSLSGFFKGGVFVTLGLLRHAKERARDAIEARKNDPTIDEKLTQPETYIKDILYHEMGHIQHWDNFKDIALAAVSAIFVGTLARLTDLIKLYQISNVYVRAAAIFLQASRIFIGGILKSIISRTIERSADEALYKYTFKDEGKEGALRGLKTLNNSINIIRPTEDKGEEFYYACQRFGRNILYYLNGTHPCNKDRVEFVEALEEDRLAARYTP